jgi:hypothetical protein
MVIYGHSLQRRYLLHMIPVHNHNIPPCLCFISMYVHRLRPELEATYYSTPRDIDLLRCSPVQKTKLRKEKKQAM